MPASPAVKLNQRQVHLDFHTSPHIPDVGAAFDPEEFADTLARAHVNSVTCFARCHHGHLYYPSRVHPERIHPTLRRKNLLGEQIRACHRRGIRVPIYTTVQWDFYSAQRHRDWLCVDEQGVAFWTKPLEPGRRHLCRARDHRPCDGRVRVLTCAPDRPRGRAFRTAARG